jgi:hypothetical protein
MQTAERVNQHQNRKRHTDQPQQQVTAHENASGNKGVDDVSIPVSKGRSGGDLALFMKSDAGAIYTPSFRGPPTGPRKARPDDRLRVSPESITTAGSMDSGNHDC